MHTVQADRSLKANERKPNTKSSKEHNMLHMSRVITVVNLTIPRHRWRGMHRGEERVDDGLAAWKHTIRLLGEELFPGRR